MTHRPALPAGLHLAAAAFVAPYVRPSASQPLLVDPPTCPCVRYVPWAVLGSSQKGFATALGYDSETWNYADKRINGVELLDFESLTLPQRNAATGLGYDVDSWDCCINHYKNYDWFEFESEGLFFVEEAFVALGWNGLEWDEGKTIPASEYKTWCSSASSDEEDVCLSESEKAAAEYVCFTESTYRKDSLTGRPFRDFESPSSCLVAFPPPPTKKPTPAPTVTPMPTDALARDVPYPPQCPCDRYTKWDDLTSNGRSFARDVLGYNRLRWNYEGRRRNNFEDQRYNNLPIGKRQQYENLGYSDSASWDCCVNHFQDFTWSEMGGRYPKARLAAAALGWNEHSWDSEANIPLSEYKTWCRNVTAAEEPLCLTQAEKDAAEQLCYSESSFRGDSMAGVPFEFYVKPLNCFDGPTAPPTHPPTSSPTTPEPTSAPTASHVPSTTPSAGPTSAPTRSSAPSAAPTRRPTPVPTPPPTPAPIEGPPPPGR